ncbi:MAG: ABC transporter permease [Oscillospiraceae bacterium]|jgi:ABC-2 type transport system permease protein|nr:ABC transporter permease [Oscillospiraceae bacterium]
MSAIFKREFRAYFTSPIAYVVMALVTFFSAYMFSYYYQSGYADIGGSFYMIFFILLIAAPLLTMRLFSEEKRQKTDQLLLTSPVSLWGIVFGKFFAAYAVFGISLIITVVYEVMFAAKAAPDLLNYFGNLLGVLLVAAALIAIGLFVSSVMESQVVAAIVSIAISIALLFLDGIVGLFKADWLSEAAELFAFQTRYTTFTQGQFSYADFLFFVGIASIFLFLTSRVLEKKRWA